MKEKIISFETAKLAKELGFDIPLRQENNVYNTLNKNIDKKLRSNQIKNWNNSKYINICSAPTQSLLQKWLREKHNINVITIPKLWNEGVIYYYYDIYTIEYIIAYKRSMQNFKTYEKAFEEGLYDALLILKNK